MDVFCRKYIIILCIVLLLRLRISTNLRWLIISCLSVLYINFYLNFTLYPEMSSLKGENQAAAYVNEFYPGHKLGVFENRRNGFEFYSHQPVRQIDMDKWMAGIETDRVFYLDDIVYQELNSRNASFTVIKEFDDHTSENVIKFLKSKNQSSHKGYLIRASNLVQ